MSPGSIQPWLTVTQNSSSACLHERANLTSLSLQTPGSQLATVLSWWQEVEYVWSKVLKLIKEIRGHELGFYFLPWRGWREAMMKYLRWRHGWRWLVYDFPFLLFSPACRRNTVTFFQILYVKCCLGQLMWPPNLIQKIVKAVRILRLSERSFRC